MDRKDNKHTIVRNGDIVNRKFRKYFLPATISAIAVSLNEFVDSLLVAQMLDANSMSIINIASPVVFVGCAVYILFSLGGSRLYSFYLGERKSIEASETLTMSLIVPLLIAITITILGIIFINPLARFFVGDALSLLTPMKKYLLPILLVLPLLVGVCIYIGFLPSFGNPNLASFIAIGCNVINLGMDVVFIKLFNFGVEGAGYATLVGYSISTIFILLLQLTGKVKVKYGKLRLKHLWSTLKKGASGSIGQIGLAIRVVVCNRIAIKYGGEMGVILMAVCDQINSIICIALTGVTDASTPIISLLHGQRDHDGKKYVVKQMFLFNGITILVEVILLCIFPGVILKLYSVPVSMYKEGVIAVIIYSLMCIFKTYIVCYEYVLDSTDKELYSSLISILYGILGIIVFTALCANFIGLRGLWIGYLVNAIVSIIIILVVNYFILTKSDKYDNILLLEKTEKGSICAQYSLEASNKSIENLSIDIANFCKENNVSNSTALKVGLVAEEMAVYTRNHHKGHFDIDVLLHLTEDNIYLDFRSDTSQFNPLSMDLNDKEENYKMLNGLAKKIEYDYILGMNSTRIVIDNK